MLAILKEISEGSFHLIGTKGFHIEAKNEIFSVVGRVVVRTLILKNFRRRLADYVIKLHQRACRTCGTIIFRHSTNDGSDL